MEKVASEHCANLNVDLQKIRGNLILYAKPFAIDNNIAQSKAELYVFTEREVTFENLQPWVNTNIQNKAKSWAASGNLDVGSAIFKNKRVFNADQCVPCPKSIVCRDP